MRNYEKKEVENQAVNPRHSTLLHYNSITTYTPETSNVIKEQEGKKKKKKLFFSQMLTIVLAYARANLAEVDLVSYILLCS